ncbi:NAD(P)-dependent oxidoreductase [Plantactinospora sp. KBS50]|uniref:NAD-dependent epimerase/dehydratase family protein n=1 Tax=Plantactinospora sp. KBS50 TaxID=2024580 RepID=UPI000BAAAD8B|nr:NAD(P)-dependent oxidoreductase [Plantactinospora sp. KBS50]ASW55951.1 reductase [Plantactinospora sp. KBS50]
MTKTALVIGATGQVGRATVAALVEDGWRVRAAARGERGAADRARDGAIEPVRLDRADDAALAAAVGAGCDLVVDMVAYGRRHADQLLGLADRIGSAVVLSSAAVYADDDGHPFGAERARFPVPIGERQRTVPGGTDDLGAEDYAAGKVDLERRLLDAGDRLPCTLLRAGAIHGPHTVFPREWYFIKRALDRRPVRILCHAGASRFQPIGTANLAELIRLAAARPGSRVLNAGDPDAPTVREIGATIADLLDDPAEEILVDGPSPAPPVGETPWSVPAPVVLDMTAAARELGYRPRTDYAGALPGTIEWLLRTVRERDWRTAFPGMTADSGTDFFDYPAEDAWLAGPRRPA